jgi:hypothetical protein
MDQALSSGKIVKEELTAKTARGPTWACLGIGDLVAVTYIASVTSTFC